MANRPTLDLIESLDPDWGLVVFALIIVAVGAWFVWKYANSQQKAPDPAIKG